jgi:hypothetical protein
VVDLEEQQTFQDEDDDDSDSSDSSDSNDTSTKRQPSTRKLRTHDQQSSSSVATSKAGAGLFGGLLAIPVNLRKLLGPCRMWWVWLLPVELLHRQVPLDDHAPRHAE